MRYFLIKENNVDVFNDRINSRLEQGWQLHGETFIYNNRISDEIIYTQAVIKKEEITKNTPILESVEQILASWNC